MPDPEPDIAPHADVEICKAIYEEALRSVAGQSAARREIRNSVSWVMGVSALALSLLGGAELFSGEDHVADWWSVIVVVLLLVFMCSAMYVWWPNREWRSGIKAKNMLDLLEKWEPRPSHQARSDFYSNRAFDLESDHDDNEAILGKLQRAFRTAMLSLGIVIVLFLGALLLGGR